MSEQRLQKVSIALKGRPPEESQKTTLAGRYVLDRELGRGGVGEVLLAHDTQLERWVAIKRILEESEGRSRLAVEEAKRLALLQHPNIVSVYDIFSHQGDVLMVMEYLCGYTLDDLKEPLPLEDFIQVARQSLGGLGAAHALGMIHLDIKPTNIMLTWLATGHIQVKVLDFGLATLIEKPAPQTLSQSGSLLGSVYNLAPEQIEQDPVGVYTDIYSLGCTFYHALSGHEPFDGPSLDAVLQAHIEHTFTPLAEHRPDLPAGVCQWVETLMARHPKDRPASAPEALKHLLEVLPKRPSRQDPPETPSRSDGSEKTPTRRRGGGKKKPAKQVPLIALEMKNLPLLFASIGQPISVEGTVERVWENTLGTIRFVNFDGFSHQEFSLLIPANTPEFSRNRLEAWVGKRIKVTGQVSDFHGHPQLIVRSPEQITAI